MPLLRGSNKLALPPSPVPNLLATNEVPSPQEARLIRDMVNKLHKEVRAFMPNPFDHTFPDSKVPAEFRKLVGFIRRHTRLLSAVHTLPDEILEEVFVLVVSTNTRGVTDRDMRRRMGNVCRRWRSVANFPRLLGHLGQIDMREPLPSRTRETRRVDQIRLHLEKSSPHPVSFRLISPNPPASSSHREAILSVLQLLVQCCERWEKAGIALEREFIPLLAPVRRRLPRLVQLFFGFPQHVPNSPPVFLDYFKDAPLLRTVRSTGIDAVNMICLPLPQLVHMENVTTHPTLVPELGILDALFVCSSLETLSSTVSTHNVSTHYLAPSSHIRHDFLKHLFVTMDGRASQTLERLSLPSLVHLTVRFHTNHHLHLSIDVLYMLRNSSRFLQYLDIRSAPSIPGALPFILEQCPYIEYIYLDGPLSLQDFSVLDDCGLSEPQHSPSSLITVPAPHLRLLQISTDPTIFPDPWAFGPTIFFRRFACSSNRLSSVPPLKVILCPLNPTYGHIGHTLERGDPSSMALLAALNAESSPQPEISQSDPIYQSVTQWRDKMLKQQRKPSSHNVLTFHRTLKEMESLEPDKKYAALLYGADIPYLLSKTSASFSLLGSRIYEDRVAELLVKWEEMLWSKSGAIGRSWIFSDDNTIEYVHQADARRKSKSWIVS